MAFKAPNGYLDFYDEIIKKSHKLIDIGYWDKIETRKLNKWLENFKTDEEKYLSALILYKLVYRNDKAIDSMISKLFHITIPNILEKYNIYPLNMTMDEWREKLRKPGSKEVINFLFSTIVSEELGDSGNDYMRRLREKFVVKELICRITDTKRRHHKSLIFIDDIIGTGKQVSTFLKKYKAELKEYDNLVFTPLIAHKKGIESIKQEFNNLGYKNNIIIEPQEMIISDNYMLDFETNENDYFDGLNTSDDLKIFYESVVDKNQLVKKSSEFFGFGNLGLTIMFATGIPDNTLPIIRNTGEDNAWIPLYEKF